VTSRATGGATATFSYDLLDHLTQWYVSSANQEQYLYDASGQRILRRSTSGSATTITTYPFGLEEHQYSGTGSNQGNTYYYSLAGRLLGKSDGTTTTFALLDGLGSVLASISNTAGSAAVKGNQLYGPYGNTRYQQGTLGTAKGFTGQYNDALTGLDYYNARYYDPVAGVFLSVDTKQGNMQGMNPYAYVNGNPETHSDPSGERPVPACYSLGCSDSSPTTQSTPACTLQDCTVIVSHKEYFITDLANLVARRNFLSDFYNQFAPGYGTAELAFFDYLHTSHRFDKQGGYWDKGDDQLAIDEFLAAFDKLNLQGAQNTIISHWLIFLAHPSNDSWWVAHNGSINAADQRARASGLYSKESFIEQHFIDETVHVINTIQSISQGSSNPLNGLFSPKGSTTGTLASIYYPKEYTDASDLASFALQSAAAVGFGGIGAGGAGSLIGLGLFGAIIW